MGPNGLSRRVIPHGAQGVYQMGVTPGGAGDVMQQLYPEIGERWQVMLFYVNLGLVGADTPWGTWGR